MSENRRPDQWEQGVFVRPERPDRRKVRPDKNLFGGEEIAVPVTTVIMFNISGKVTEKKDDACAKCEETDGHVRFFTKFSTDGYDKGQLLDPWGVYFKPSDLTKLAINAGRSKYEYRQVKESAFHDYLHYLTTHDPRYLRSAERQVLDA